MFMKSLCEQSSSSELNVSRNKLMNALLGSKENTCNKLLTICNVQNCRPLLARAGDGNDEPKPWWRTE